MDNKMEEMKKIQVYSCKECIYCAQYDNGSATCGHPQLYIEIDSGITQAVETPTDGTVHPDCPLEDDLPESKERNNDGNWLSPIPSERKVQEKQLKEFWPDYPNGCPKWQTLNGLLYYTNRFMELDGNPNGWISVNERLPEEADLQMSNDVLTLAGTKMSVKCYDYELKRWTGSPHVTVTHWQHLPIPPQDIDKTIT
jgi:hypothetical protein